MELAHRDITYCKNVGAKRADILRKELKVDTAMDMLRQYPYKYIDRSRFYKIAEIDDEDTYVQIIGEDESNPYDSPVTYKAVNEVDTLEKAIDYVAREFGVVAKTKVKALNEAHKHGIDFPNLK